MKRLPVADDVRTLEREEQAIEDADKVRAWYEAWEQAWEMAYQMSYVGKSYSQLWGDVTREARRTFCHEDADPGKLLRWLTTYTGNESDLQESES